jgi:hypothetical protein
LKAFASVELKSPPLDKWPQELCEFPVRGIAVSGVKYRITTIRHFLKEGDASAELYDPATGADRDSPRQFHDEVVTNVLEELGDRWIKSKQDAGSI